MSRILKFILVSLESVQIFNKIGTRREPPLDFVSGISRPQKRDQTLKYNEKYFGLFGNFWFFMIFQIFSENFRKSRKISKKLDFAWFSFTFPCKCKGKSSEIRLFRDFSKIFRKKSEKSSKIKNFQKIQKFSQIILRSDHVSVV